MAPNPVHIVLGTAGSGYAKPEQVAESLDIVAKHGVSQIDTAYIYGGSEAILGKLDAPKRFLIGTKANGFIRGCQSKQGIIDSLNQSFENLGVDSVDIYYLHSPDPATPIEDTLAGIQELYSAGKFKRFGLSNFLPSEVQKVYDIQAAAKSVLPTVFQGNYSAVARLPENELFPLLHKLKISFYAYSPIAGGFLVKTSASIREKNLSGRYGQTSQVGNMYNSMYAKESLLDALDEWDKIATEAGISKAALAYRWIVWHSALKSENGDAVIIGASSTAQLEETLSAVEAGPLSEKSVESIEGIWKKVEADAPLDNYESFLKNT